MIMHKVIALITDIYNRVIIQDKTWQIVYRYTSWYGGDSHAILSEHKTHTSFDMDLQTKRRVRKVRIQPFDVFQISPLGD
jgi:hypothetical protein